VARLVTIATVLVVLLGAIVRITGSGAGCGQHWPTCNGEIVHLPRRIETWIEFSHRLTSGVDFIGVLGLAGLALFRLRRADPARIATFAALLFMLVEIAVGARLVLLNLVGSNLSIDRVVVMPIHLVTTSLLIGSLGLATYFSGRDRLARSPHVSGTQLANLRAALLWLAGAGVLLLVVSMSGAVTALGDSVYPVRGQGTLEHLANDQAVGAHVLGKLRVVHPLLALLGVGALWVAGGRAREACGAGAAERLAAAMQWGAGLAMVVGVANIWLGAPGYVQVIHLAIACLLWLSIVVLLAMVYDLQTRTNEEAHEGDEPRDGRAGRRSAGDPGNGAARTIARGT